MRRLLMIFMLFTAVNGTAADKWTSAQAKNFHVVGNASESQVRGVAEDMEQFRASLSEVFSSTGKPSTIPTTVIVFKNDDAFRPFKPVVDNKPAAVTGYSQMSEDLNYICLVAGSPVPHAVYHDYVHQIVNDLPAAVPLWFAEGVADFYSAVEISGRDKKLTLGQAIPEYMDVLKKEPLQPLEKLFAVDRSSPEYNERSRKGIFYAESWALVNYLVMGDNGKRQPQLPKFLDMLAANTPLEESFKTAFAGDYKKLENELQNWLRDPASWPSSVVTLKDRNEIGKDIKTRTVTEGEAEFYLGDYLMHASRLSEAEFHLKQAVALEPSLGVAQAAMGMLRFRADDFPESLKLLKHATELDSKNYLVQYYYAYVLDKSSTTALDDLDAKRSALGKVIELAPQYVPAYEMMAYLNLTADLDYNGTLDLLQKARTFAPGNPNLLFLTAQVYVKKEDFDSADKLLKSLSASNSIPLSLQDAISNLNNYIARFRNADNRDREAAEAEARRDEAAARPAAPPTPEVPRNPEPASASTAAEPLPASSPAPSSAGKRGELQLDSPQPALPAGTRITGSLTLIDCKSGMTMTIKTATDTIKLHSDNPGSIRFVSYVKNVTATISCGPVAGAGTPVAVTYRPTPEGPTVGEPLMVEFVEK